MAAKNYVSNSQVVADRLTELKATISKSQAERKMRVLNDYTYKKQITSLQAEVKKSESDSLAKKSTYELELTKLEKLRRQIDKCKLFAPNDGLIVYATDGNMFRMNNQATIEEGATVRERQKIFSLPDIARMQVNAKVHESMINRIEVGQKVNIKVDAFPNEKLTGTVKTVNPLPDQGNFLASDVKLYTTIVTIDQSFASLRPGMTAECVVLINTVDDALVIPVTAVLPLKGKDYVYVVTPNGPERREITLGDTNDIQIEVKKGLNEGEKVVLNPTALVSEAEKNEAFSSASRTSARVKDFGDAKVEPKPAGAAGAASPGEDKAKAKTKRGGAGGMGGMNPALMEKFKAMRNLPPEDLEKLKSGSEEEKKELMKKAGFTDAELQQLEQMRQQFGGGGGGGGGFGGGGRPPGGGGPPGGVQ
jgi:RND family efflux transporter MFP subunit